MHDKTAQLAEKLSPFVPEGTAAEIAELIIHHKVLFRISRPRSSKYGDYRAPNKHHGHRISVNGNLNPYAFLVTTLHEFAHLIAFETHGSGIMPHGDEWKKLFGDLLRDSLRKQIFPADVEIELARYLKSPSASGCADHGLMRALRNHDEDPAMLLEELPENAHFMINGNRVFLKGSRLRKRFRCQDIHNKRFYLISAIAEVIPV